MIDLSLVIGAYNMERELPRTLYTLSRRYQREAADLRYEVIIVDNGSDRPVDKTTWRDLDCEMRYMRFEAGNPSPVVALNEGLKAAKGQWIGLMIDGARMLSPGIFCGAKEAGEKYGPRAVISSHGMHLGPVVQAKSILKGYNQKVEDELLAGIDWRNDGYRLFDISVFGGSSYRGWEVNPTESNCLILSRELWGELNYLDERFLTPGGGLVNLDIYKRACEAPNTQLVLLKGEATFHQFHGGAATSKTCANPNEEFDREYEMIRGERFRLKTYPNRILYTPREP